jgi:hypothetical protein
VITSQRARCRSVAFVPMSLDRRGGKREWVNARYV